MDAVLEQIIVDRLAAADLGEGAADLVLAACGGAAELEAALHGAAPERETPDPQLALAERDLGVYLASVSVQGFRGVGKAVELSLDPGPGLTIVVGRNGSGKSSFAEGLELLMTGANSRWAARTKVWSEGWQNLHFDGDTVLEARLQVEGDPGATHLRRAWPHGTLFAPGQCEATAGDGTPTSLDGLGWTTALSRYRPFLSFNELGSMFDEQKHMYDALSAILGLDDVDDLAETLRQARLARDKQVKAGQKDAAAIAPLLADVDDPRATTVADALASRTPDLDAIAAAVEGTDASGDLSVLRALTSLAVADEPALDERIAALETARAELAALRGTDAGRAESVSRLLSAALEHHQHHAAADCPVCGNRDALDDDWQSRTIREITRLDHEASTAEHARRAESAARRRVADLLPPSPPSPVTAARDLGLDPAELEIAWDRWRAERDDLDDPSSLARLRETVARVRRAAHALAARAQVELDHREDAWRPVARRLNEWLPVARAAAAADAARSDLKTAEDWVKATAAELRDERLDPIADAARENWGLLRQESNVSLEGFRLHRSGTSRRAEIDVRVDDSEASAIGVMSQGELHALAVSVFLPRAALPESPFRFAVIDDPVQSMDPAKVDGLARALARAARARQIIVFTHDERLTEATRRLALDATVFEVTRRPNSVVGIRAGLDPVARYLDDARALTLSEEVPREVVDRVVPGLCRHALEAACTLVVRRRRLARGEAHADIDAALDGATTLYRHMALALFDDAGRSGDVLGTVNNRFGRDAADAMKAANAGVHETVPVDLRAIERLARALAA